MLIDDIIEDDSCQEGVTVIVDGEKMNGYQIAKPLNYGSEYLPMEERWKMAQLIMAGKAIAVQYFSDLTEDEQVAYVKKKMGK